MASNSIRINERLFQAAQSSGALLSRSAAQQVEHWARIGAAVEASGLSVAAITALLRHAGDGAGVEHTTEQALWAFKRERQQADLAAAAHDARRDRDSSWFEGRAAQATAIDSPY